MKTHPPDRDVATPRFEKKGKAYVYVLPRAAEDHVKLGFSRDPFERFRTLHPRFHDFFDLQQGLLIEVDTIKEARRIERLLIERWPEHRAAAPFDVSAQAGGHTEWFRGINDAVVEFSRRVADRYGYTLHAPLSQWLSGRMSDYAGDLYDWSLRMFEIIEWQHSNVPSQARDGRYASVLRETLDAFRAVGMDTDSVLPRTVQRWYASQRSGAPYWAPPP